MRIGLVFPQLEIGTDPTVIREYAQATEEMGYDHLLAFDHVLGTDQETVDTLPGPYTYESMFHEPLVLFGYLAAVTQRIELVTSILILPQRQTVLVAKQAAEVDVLSRGRLRLGVGVGWNPVEFEGLNEDFSTRGKRIEEQVDFMRRLWSEPIFSYTGEYHRLTRAGINPLPERRSIPVWMGGTADVVIDRVGRVADGWFPQYRNPARLPEGIAQVKEAARKAGRDPESIGIESRVQAARGVEAAIEHAQQWLEGGATHVSMTTMDAGFTSIDQHLEAARGFIEGLRAS